MGEPNPSPCLCFSGPTPQQTSVFTFVEKRSNSLQFVLSLLFV